MSVIRQTHQPWKECKLELEEQMMEKIQLNALIMDKEAELMVSQNAIPSKEWFAFSKFDKEAFKLLERLAGVLDFQNIFFFLTFSKSYLINQKIRNLKKKGIRG